MPSIIPNDVSADQAQHEQPLTRLPFKPVTREHILHCSYDYWHPKYRSSALRSRIIPLPATFLTFLREDGIILPSDDKDVDHTFPPPSTYNDTSTSTGWDDTPTPNPFPELHATIKNTIAELGGLVAPKLNWSSPKDATWISMKKNSMECATPNDIYLLLKSSDFVTHDLEHAFDDTEDSESVTSEGINYVLVLRKWFKVNPSCEFRCFVRERRLIGMCQRDLNHFDFLFPLADHIRDTVMEYFDKVLKNTFPEEDFVFDIYIPEGYDKVRLVDINPWAPRTDPLLFSWLELLTLKTPPPLLGTPDTVPPVMPTDSEASTDNEEDDVEELEWKPELRLVKKDDPEAYSFASPQYSAHKLPKDVVDASLGGESSMRDFADDWKKMMDGGIAMQRPGEDSESESEDGKTA